MNQVSELQSPPATSESTGPELAPTSGVLTQEVYDFGHGEILRFTPAEVRPNEATGEPVAPLVYIQGMNGGDKLPPIMAYLAENDRRPVIGIRYHGKAQGSPKPVQPGEKYYRPDAAIPTLDAQRADDLLGALQVLGDVQHVVIAGESGGAPRALLIAQELQRGAAAPVRKTEDQVPIKVEGLMLVDPAGQDGRSYIETHGDAVRQLVKEKAGAVALELIAEFPKSGQVAKFKHDRPEQRAVGYVQMGSVLAHVAQQVQTRVLSDEQDAAFLTDRIANTMQATGAAKHAKLVKTNKGGHGVGLNKAALDVVITNLHEMELAA